MLAATLLAIFFVPVQYYVVETLAERRGKRTHGTVEREREPVEATD
jgi:hypothetical protein